MDKTVTEPTKASRVSDAGPSNESKPALTPLEEAVHDSIDAMENIQDEARNRVLDMFELLDLDALLSDPTGYMSHFGETIIQSHMKTTVQEAIDAGRAAGKKIADVRK